MSSANEISAILARVREGRGEAFQELMPLVYDELKQLAQRLMARERREHTLQATALVNEAYLRLLGGAEIEWKGRAHFFAVAAQGMRRVLIDYARARSRKKRAGVRENVAVEGLSAPSSAEAVDLIDLESALTELEQIDPRKVRVVELRLFGGLTLEEAAEALFVTRRTVDRDWQFAKTWLYQKLVLDPESEGGDDDAEG